MSGYLELADGALMVVKHGLVLGRVAACDIVVDDTKASRRHARLIVEGGVVEIEDLGSSNGTLLNGKPIERRMLRDGDEVRIGKTAIVYREGELPGSRARSSGGAAAAAAAASVFDDDDDLFGGDGDGGDDGGIREPDIAPPPPRAEPAPEPKVEAPPPPPIEPVSPPPVPPSHVVEFEDEVVEVEQAPQPRPEPRPSPRPEPLVDVRPKSSLREPVVEARSPATPASSAKGAGKGGDDVVASSQRILQFSKKQGGGSLLGDDLGQMSAGMRALLVVALLAAGVGVAWGVVHLMR